MKSMEASSYMVNDFVSVSKNPIKVGAVFHHTIYDIYGNAYSDEDVCPIRLTEDILVNNEWKNKRGEYDKHSIISEFVSGRNRWHPKRLEGSFLLFSLSNKKFAVLIVDRLITVEYVHELQQILRFCGFEDIANDLKV